MQQKSKSGLFLMELIIAILFFSISSAICIQLFVGAFTKSKQSDQLNTALLQAQTVAEYYRSCNGDLKAMANMVMAKETSDGYYVCYYDQEGSFDSRAFSSYEMRFLQTQQNGINSLCIDIYPINESDGNVIYSLTVAQHTPYTLPLHTNNTPQTEVA